MAHAYRNGKLIRPEYSYVGRLPCGCAVAITLDYGDKITANNVRDFIVEGLTVERVKFGTPEYSEIIDRLGCVHEKRHEEPQPMLFEAQQ